MKTALLAVVAAMAVSQAAGVRVVHTPYSDARPILTSLRKEFQPPDLAESPDPAARWSTWIAARDAAIRARVLAGDDESVANLLLFGTTFTTRPRVTERELAQQGGAVSRESLIDARIEDLIAGATAPGDNARLQFTRDLLSRHGFPPNTPGGRGGARRFLKDAVARAAADIARIDQAADAVRAQGPGGDAIARSTLFRERGLATDTSLLSSFAIERAIDGLSATGTLDAGTVRRVAIVGPGLDFADKRDGFDFYPLQTIQPFAVIDSLVRHRLSGVGTLRLTTLDLNPRINAHVSRAAEQGRAGHSYPLTLVRDLGLSWAPRLAAYWETIGSSVASQGRAAGPPQGVAGVDVRTLAVRPDVAAVLEARDLDIVTQRLDGLPATDRFDLIVATDILIYYDVFEQSLALANIAAMLRPGGIFLSNVTLSELPVLPIGSIGFSDVVYLEQPELGDRVVWYRRESGR